MSRWTIAGIVAAASSALAASFAVGRYTGYNKGVADAISGAAPQQKVAANA